MFFLKKQKKLSLYFKTFLSITASLIITVSLNKFFFISNSPLINFPLLNRFSKNIINFRTNVKLTKKKPFLTNPRIKKDSLPTIKLKITPLPSIKPTIKHLLPTKAQTYPTVQPTKKSQPIKKPHPTKKISPPSTNCPQISNQRYSTLKVLSPPTDRPAKNHPDLNLKIRGFKKIDAKRKLINLNGDTDPKAPKLKTFIAGNPQPKISQTYQVYDWDWRNNRRGSLLTQPYSVTLISLKTSPGQKIQVPQSGYDIGNGFQAMVLYADSNSITLKYTREDNVVSGYTLHILDFCVDPNLLSLYQQLNNQGRQSLPALYAQEQIGTAKTENIKIALRDTGQFMDPRSKKDWW